MAGCAFRELLPASKGDSNRDVLLSKASLTKSGRIMMQRFPVSTIHLHCPVTGALFDPPGCWLSKDL